MDTTMQTWEYLVLHLDVHAYDYKMRRVNGAPVPNDCRPPLHEALNSYGAQGWEVVGTLGAVKDGRDEAVLLKRLKA
jgi:hypothetical protein